MTIRELLLLESKKSSVEEFFALLYGQKIDPAFRVINELSINFNLLEGMSVFCFHSEDYVYFKLCFFDLPFLIYKFNNNNDCLIIMKIVLILTMTMMMMMMIPPSPP